ncbi:MAG: S8 family serine peptidase [Bdellovibrionales bacterium]
MRRVNSIGLAAISALMLGTVACTQTLILFKPSPVIDPMPNTDACPKVVEADPQAKDQWTLSQLGVSQEVLQSGVLDGNANVRIAIMSTGVDYNHPDLCGQIAINKAEITQKAIGDRPDVNREDDDKNGLVDDIAGYDVVDGDGLAYDRHGAGTAVAGIIAANQSNGIGIAGLMKNVTLLPIRYIDNNGQASIASLAGGLEATLKLKPHVIFIQSAQIQVGGHRQEAALAANELGILKGYLDRVRDAKIPVIVGAGDDMGQFGSTEIDKLLKSYDNVLIITAVDKEGKRSLLANTHSQDVLTAAPGEEVLTLKPGGKTGLVNGTAYAAAHVTAAVGLARAALADRLDTAKLIQTFISAKGSEPDAALERDTRGGTRLQIVKFLGEIRGH